MDEDNDYDAKLRAQNQHNAALEKAQIVAEIEALTNKLARCSSSLMEEVHNATWESDIDNIEFLYTDIQGVIIHLALADAKKLEQRHGIKLKTVIGGVVLYPLDYLGE